MKEKRIGGRKELEPALLYLGCNTPTSQYAFELSTRVIIKELSLPIEDYKEFNCCGYPIYPLDRISWLYLSARNLALTEEEKRNLVPLCNGCYISLREAKEVLLKEDSLRRNINKQLSKEGLKFVGRAKIIHLIDILFEERERIKAKVVKPFSNRRIAAHLGCHGEEERGEAPTNGISRVEKMFEIMRDIGIETATYPTLHECCGAGAVITEKDFPDKLAGQKLLELLDLGYEGLATICPFCQRQYESKQGVISRITKKIIKLPVYYLTQLIGLSWGIKEDSLGLQFNRSLD